MFVILWSWLALCKLWTVLHYLLTSCLFWICHNIALKNQPCLLSSAVESYIGGQCLFGISNNLSNTSLCPFNEKVYWQILTLFVTAWQKSIKDHILSDKHSKYFAGFDLNILIIINWNLITWLLFHITSKDTRWICDIQIIINGFWIASILIFILPIHLLVCRMVQKRILDQLK